MHIYTKVITTLDRTPITRLSDHHCVSAHGMHVELDNPYSGFLRQFRRTRVIKRLESVSRTFFCRTLQHLSS